MSDPRPERHLAAIVVADVVGYGRLIERNEAATLQAIKRRRESIIDPLAADFKGRAVKFMGDGVLLEFGSAVDAVEFAAVLQKRLLAANAEEIGQEDILFRIGINVGDIVTEAGDVFGEGVNIAARLETMAEPGGVLVSESVYRQVKGRVPATFRDLGERRLKNVSEPMLVYRVDSPGPETALSVSSANLAIVPAGEKMSIAVLPFDNMSGKDEETYFSDGITEDIITELSRFRELRVIARNSSFQFRGGKNDIRDIGRKLDARFIIEGSVRRSGNRIRITVQLIETESQAHVWSDRYDREITDVFEVQEEIARLIATKVAGNTRAATVERARSRPTESLSAYELFLRVRQHALTYNSEDKDIQFEQMLLRVIEIDPQFAAVYGMLADLGSVQFLRSGNPTFIDKAVAYGRRGVAANPEDPWANYGLSIALIYKNALADAGFYIQRAVELNPNDVTFLGIYAVWLGYVGRAQEARVTIGEALRRDPYTQEWFWDIQGILFMLQGMYREAIESYAKMREFQSWHHCFRAFCAMKAGAPDRARTILTAFKPDSYGLGPSGLMDAILPDIDPDFRKDFLDTLRNLEVGLFDMASPQPEAS